MVIILTTVGKTAAETLAFAGKPTHTTLPRLRQYYTIETTLFSEINFFQKVQTHRRDPGYVR